MPQQPISLSPDLMQLREDGYEVSIEHGHLVVHGIPYVNAQQQVKRGTLVSTLALSGNQTNRPNTHVVLFAGDYPCDQDGKPIDKIRHSSTKQTIGAGLSIDHSFSSKPKAGYSDYYEKMTTYAAILSSPAATLDPSATPRTYRIIEAPDDSPFVYFDNASGRAGISHITRKLMLNSVAIIGLGGTGSYVLDLVAKTPVNQIDLFDADVFEQHNAFRAPGAPSMDELRQRPRKVDYFAGIYSKMHKGVVPHSELITPANVDLLQNQAMVFICIDKSEIKLPIIRALETFQVPFIDVGMGIDVVDSALIGTLRTTTSTPHFRTHVHDRARIPRTDAGLDDLYAQNIQVADLNALNACLAVIRWKKLCGFYVDTEGEHFSLFTLDANHLLNEDAA
nr:ThiF family adenylyltransferase [uncultured Cohaesibacter sp.]